MGSCLSQRYLCISKCNEASVHDYKNKFTAKRFKTLELQQNPTNPAAEKTKTKDDKQFSTAFTLKYGNSLSVKFI